MENGRWGEMEVKLHLLLAFSHDGGALVQLHQALETVHNGAR